MKKFKAFFSKHPILEMLFFNVIAIPVATGAGIGISCYSGWDTGTVIFVESIFVLMICYSAINGNAGAKTAGFVYDRKVIADHESHYGAYHFAIKYGILGVGLFLMSGLFGMK